MRSGLKINKLHEYYLAIGREFDRPRNNAAFMNLKNMETGRMPVLQGQGEKLGRATGGPLNCNFIQSLL